jgi:thiol:disulfide interchange protein DsbD
MLLGLIVIVAFLIWTWKNFRTRGRIISTSGAILLMASMAIVMPNPFSLSSSAPTSIGFWQPFSLEKIEQVNAENRPLFINFTATWCIVCQVNEQTTFQDQSVRDFVSANNIIMMKADWTHYDKTIGKLLQKYDRVGVPLYLYFGKGVKDAIVLPEVLTPNLLKEYLVSSN